MEHVVFYPAHDGSPAFRRVAGLEEAVRLVEHLRNVEGVSEVSVHTLSEVPLAFKAYYRVEVPAGEAPAAEAPALEPATAVADSAAEPAAELHLEVPAVELPSQPIPAMAASNGNAHEAKAPSSLGFFSR